MRAGFLELAQHYADRFRVIDGAGDMDDVAADIAAVVDTALTKRAQEATA